MIEGTEPVARYNYTESGNYTLRLQVGANMTKQEVPIAGDYSMDLKVLGRSDYYKTSLSNINTKNNHNASVDWAWM